VSLEVRDLVKEYPTPAGPLSVLRGITLTLAAGEAVSIMGPSGGGKSTLLFLLGALDEPTSGTVRLDGKNPFELPPEDLARFRNRSVGFVFQDHCLLPQCSVLENVLAPTLVAPKGDYQSRAEALLKRVGLEHRLSHRPAALSGGEKQRVSIARALIREPRLLLCDEPTGNLDSVTAESIGSLLLDSDLRDGRILVTVTHSAALADRFPARMEMRDGRLQRRS
jgi:lipoprotein-releasing system ATP-binding protein